MRVMQIKCEYCENLIEDTVAQCPHCGAPNPNMNRSASGIPKTIDELLAYCSAKNIEPNKYRFFIGEDYKEPKAYGIFKADDGNFIVYKNKADGSRAVRYRGTDEAYAVNEIYQKLRQEFLDLRQRTGQPSKPVRQQTQYSYPNPSQRKKRSGCSTKLIIAAIVIGLLLLAYCSEQRSMPSSSSGYSSSYSGSSSYSYGNSYDSGYSGGSSYSYDNNSSYDDDDDWGSDWGDDWGSYDYDWGSDWDSDW